MPKLWSPLSSQPLLVTAVAPPGPQCRGHGALSRSLRCPLSASSMSAGTNARGRTAFESNDFPYVSLFIKSGWGDGGTFTDRDCNRAGKI